MKPLLVIAAMTLSAGNAFALDCAISQSRMQRQNYVHHTGNMNYEFTITKLNQSQGCVFKLSYPFDDVFADENNDYSDGPANPKNEDVDASEWVTLPISLAMDSTDSFVRGIEHLYSADGSAEAPFKLNHNVVRKCYAEVTKLINGKAKKAIIESQKMVCVNEIVNQIRALVPAHSAPVVTKPIEEKLIVLDPTVEKALTCSVGMETYHTCSYVKGNKIADEYRLCLKDGNFGELRLVNVGVNGKMRKLNVAQFSQVEEQTEGEFENGEQVKYKQVQFLTPLVMQSEAGATTTSEFKQYGVMNKKSKNVIDNSYSHELELSLYTHIETIDLETKQVLTQASAHIGFGDQNKPGYFKCRN